MSKSPRVGVWFAASATVFFTRAFMFSTWLSRGPEVQSALHLNTAQMGLLVMVYPIGGVIGLLFAKRLAIRFGSRSVTVAAFSVASAAMVALGFVIPTGNVFLAVLFLTLMGAPLSMGDYVGNFEATQVDKTSKRSLIPMIHGAFGVGMMLAAGLSSIFITLQTNLQLHYVLAAAVGLVPSVWAAMVFPDAKPASDSATTQKAIRVYTEKRTLIICFIGFTFILAESSAGTWMPIALTQAGYSSATAASALGIFWLVVTGGRVIGGWVTDRLGRSLTVAAGAWLTVGGLALFMLNPILHVPYLALFIWGIGMANGFPLSVSSLSDNPVGAQSRVNLIVTMVYLSSITAGPALGSAGETWGLSAAFGIPLALMALAALLSGATRRETA
jgi:predicted MFS family arabinose efflux permease